MRDGTARRLSRLHTGLYRATRGRIGRRLVDNDMLLLTTTGRVSKAPHTVPLLYLSDNPHYIVFASWGGRPTHPQWYLNLLDDQGAVVQVESSRFPVIASTLDGTERARWWAEAEIAYDGYRTYQSRTEREIPVVRLQSSD